MIAITSFSKKLYDQYAHRLIESIENWPTPLVVYSEDKLKLPVKVVSLQEKCPKLLQFQAGCQTTSDYRYDAARFASKVFAFCHGAWNADDLVFWLDADIIVHKPVSKELLRGLLPKGTYAGYFGRDNFYTETGFHVLDARHPVHRTFLSEWRNVYLDGTIFRLPQWHDCMAYDFVRTEFEAAGVKFENLSGIHSGHQHPMCFSPLGELLDHCKGPRRKQQGYSEEHPVYGVHNLSGVLGDAERRSFGVQA